LAEQVAFCANGEPCYDLDHDQGRKNVLPDHIHCIPDRRSAHFSCFLPARSPGFRRGPAWSSWSIRSYGLF